MTFSKRELYQKLTHYDRRTLVFDTASKRLYVELGSAPPDVTVSGPVDHGITTMDIADYLKQGGQNAGHRELRRLLRKLFRENHDGTEATDDTSSAAMTYNKLRIWENCCGDGFVF